MTRYQSVSLDLSDAVLAALGDAADAAGCGPSDYLRTVLTSALSGDPARQRREEEAIRRALHLARGWPDLRRRLRAAGYTLRPGPDGGLSIDRWPRGGAVLDTADLGYSLAGLVLRFGAAYPHSAGRRFALPRHGHAA